MSEQATSTNFSKELAEIALSMQSERTGHTPKAVTVVASDETVVVTLHEALTPAEKILARTDSGCGHGGALSPSALRRVLRRVAEGNPASDGAKGTRGCGRR
jgi:hypothetical protein